MNPVHRREFLSNSAAVAAGLAAAPFASADEKVKNKVSPNEKVVVALIGCGGMGRYNMHDFIRLPDFEIAAVCDVDKARIKEALDDLKKGNRPTDKVQTEQDFRKIIDRK